MFFPLSLSLSLSLQGTVAMGALTEDVLAPISPTTGWCPDWWSKRNTTWRSSEDGSSDPIPFSLSVISYGLKFKLVFFPKKGGATYQGHFIFSWGFQELPWKPSSRHLERCHPQNQSKILPKKSILASFFRRVFHVFTSDLKRKNIQK